MSETMVERVARGLLASESNGELTWDALSLIDRGAFKRDARAAIEAMREPTPEMKHEGGVVPAMTDFDEQGRDVGDYTAEQVWSAMIDAALK